MPCGPPDLHKDQHKDQHKHAGGSQQQQQQAVMGAAVFASTGAPAMRLG
jgi:hypothetical protein